jgi:hypothetical protein
MIADLSVNPDNHHLLKCLEEDMLRDPYLKATVRFTKPPDILIIQMKFYKYNLKEDKMISVSQHWNFICSSSLQA